MESRTRLEDLDARITSLTRELQALQTERAGAEGIPVPHGPARDRLGLAAGMALMVAAVGAALALYGTAALAPTEKVAIGYGASVAGLAYGVFAGSRRRFLPQAAFGLGLAALHATTYAAFLLPRLSVFPNRDLALPVLLGTLLVVLFASHLRRASAAAAIGLAAICATAVLSATRGTLTDAGYALGICAATAAVSLLLQAQHGWRSPAWAALVGTYATFALYLLAGSRALDIPPEHQLRLSLAFLGLVFLVFCAASILGARRSDTAVRGAVLLPFINAAACYALARLAIDRFGSTELRGVDLALAGVLGLFAIVAAARTPRRERLTEAFLAAMLLVLAWALATQLSDAGLWLAPAAACLVIAILYARTGVVFLKAVNLLLLLATFVASLWAIHWKGNLAIETYPVVANWLVGASVPVALAFAATTYTRFVRRRLAPPSGKHWLLEGTPLDIPDAHMALLHAAAGALLLLAITIFRLGDDPALPYAVAAEAVITVAAGYVLFTPAIRMAGVSLLVAAHVVYYFFLLTAAGRASEGGLLYPLGLALLTYGAAILWERHIRHAQGLRPREYDPVAAVPYLVAAYLITDLLAYHLSGVYAPLAQNGLGLVLLACALLASYGGIKLSGLFAITIGTAFFALRLHETADTLGEDHFLPLLGAFLLTYAVGERILARLQRPGGLHRRIEAGGRTLLVLTAAAVGAVSLYAAVPGAHLTVALLGLAAALALLGALFREVRYAWAALPVLAVAAGRGLLYDIPKLDTVPALLLGAAAVILSLAAAGAWLSVRRKARAKPKPADAPAGDQVTDGRPA